MESVKLNSYVGQDGMLHLNVPVDYQEMELEVTVTFQPVQSSDNFSDTEDFNQLEWHEFVRRTAGSCANDPIIIDNEGIDDSLDDDLTGVFNDKLRLLRSLII